MAETSSQPLRVPHKGFSHKAREILLDRGEVDGTKKTGSNKKIHFIAERSESQATSSSKSSTQSIHSIPEPIMFDSIDDVAKRKAKMHKTLGELGKTRSVDQIRAIDRRLMRTFVHDNILRLPSADSDLADYQPAAKPLPKKAGKYEATNEDDS